MDIEVSVKTYASAKSNMRGIVAYRYEDGHYYLKLMLYKYESFFKQIPTI